MDAFSADDRGEGNDAHAPTTTMACLAVALMALANVGCGGARPYRLMAKAATSETSVFSQVEDQRLKTALREALLRRDPGAAFSIRPYAYMGHAYLVGFVDSAPQRQTIVAAVQSIEGERSLDTYLPEKPAGGRQRRATSRSKPR